MTVHRRIRAISRTAAASAAAIMMRTRGVSDGRRLFSQRFAAQAQQMARRASGSIFLYIFAPRLAAPKEIAHQRLVRSVGVGKSAFGKVFAGEVGVAHLGDKAQIVVKPDAAP